MSREHPQLRVRVPPELKEQLEDKARSSGRTLTAEIVYRLQQSIEEEQAETGGIRQMDMRIFDPSIGKPQKVVNALEEMQRILNEALGALEDDDQDEDD